jgi:hypothetical protein
LVRFFRRLIDDCEIGFGGTRRLQAECGRCVLYSTHLALQNAASIVSLMLTTAVLIADIKQEEEMASVGAGHGGMGGMY